MAQHRQKEDDASDVRNERFPIALERCVCLDIEVWPRRWRAGFGGLDQTGTWVTWSAETAKDLRRILAKLAKNKLTIVGYNITRYDIPVMRAILAGEDPYPVSKVIVELNRWPEGMDGWPEFPCDHVDLVGRTRFGKYFPSLKLLMARYGRPRVQELPFDPHAELDDAQWEVVCEYNRRDLEDTRFLLEQVEPELETPR